MNSGRPEYDCTAQPFYVDKSEFNSAVKFPSPSNGFFIQNGYRTGSAIKNEFHTIVISIEFHNSVKFLEARKYGFKKF
ncbi:hypothetical protein DMB44_05490 [Thermoplasma sp. Kam2015]|uniref:hypothetical protein n=1 Tax=Thermoplasma sp. Kam2015 TaxID=2094122 RepID=UPI000D94421C|nr:hypothetical protein [Thermoplasma sp. Kam2015]PYB68175.1 hypothetical protein DMB44_05490 [Thermoplasma sp. Kam2015]